MKLWFFLFLALTACASSPETEDDAPSASTASCLNDPALSEAWGECNVKSTIYKSMGKITSCFHAKKKASPPGEMLLTLRLQSNGKVEHVHLDQGLEKDKDLSKCLKRELAGLRFASPPKGVKPVIYYPLNPEVIRD